MALCLASDALGRGLARQAARLAVAGGPDVGRAMSFVGDLPELGPGGGAALDRAAVEAYAGLYYYGELEQASLIALAELVVEQRFELTARIDDRALLEALDAMEEQMRRGWYDQPRREALFANMLGLGTEHDIRLPLAGVTGALARFDQALRFGRPSQSDGIAVEFAMADFLGAAAARAGMGLGRAAQVLNGQLRQSLAILGNATLHRTFRVSDMWQLIREVAVTPDGGQPDLSAITERAQAGAAVIGWMAGRLAEIGARNGSLSPVLVNDATLFRQAARWTMAARSLGLRGSPDGGGSRPGGFAPDGAFGPTGFGGPGDGRPPAPGAQRGGWG